MTAEMKLGLAGLGVHGMRYALHLLRGDVPGARLAAVSRSDEAAGRAFALRHGLRFVADPLELTRAPDLDAVVVVLPPDVHPTMALACAGAARPVLVEKPLAPDGAAARRIVAEVERTGSFLMVAHTLRFDPLVRRLREEVATLGPIRVVALNQRFEPSERAWIDEPGRGGCVLNTGVHGFDLLRHLTGCEPVSIQAEVERAVTRRTDDTFAAAIRLEPGAVLATMDNARTTHGRSGRIEIVGEHGQVSGDHVHRWLRRIEGRIERDLGPVEPAATVAETLRAFVGAIRSGAPPPVTARDGAIAVEMADAAIVSAREGRRVTLGGKR